MPLLILPAIYITVIYSRYGTIQPTLANISSTEYYQSSFFYTLPEERKDLTFLQYLGTYLNNFFLSWSGLVTEDTVANKSNPFAASTLPMELLWLLPAFAFFKFGKKVTGSLSLPILAGWAAIIVTSLIQFNNAYGQYIRNGYLGGSQARYYLPLIFAMALSVPLLFEGLKEYIHDKMIYILSVVYGFMLFYGNFPFFLMHI